jgi:uncharacterized protein YneF (UPF0154 family)
MKKLKTINTTFKFIFLGVFIVLLTSFTSPNKTGKKIYKTIKKNKVEKLDSHYITKEELRSLVNEMDPKPSEEQINNVLDAYDSGKESYLNTF